MWYYIIYNHIGGDFLKVTTSKSKNSESFYISQSYINNVGKSTSKVIRKLGTLEELSAMLNTDREGVYAWAKEQAKLETEKYNKSNEEKTVLIPFHSNRQLDYGIQKIFEGGYFFFNVFIMTYDLMPFAVRLSQDIFMSMISTQFFQI